MISGSYLLWKKWLEVVILAGSGICRCHPFNDHVFDYVLGTV